MNSENDVKIKNYQKRQIIKWTVISLYLVVIALEILALCGIIDMLWGCALFVFVYLFKKIFLK